MRTIATTPLLLSKEPSNMQSMNASCHTTNSNQKLHFYCSTFMLNSLHRLPFLEYQSIQAIVVSSPSSAATRITLNLDIYYLQRLVGQRVLLMNTNHHTSLIKLQMPFLLRASMTLQRASVTLQIVAGTIN